MKLFRQLGIISIALIIVISMAGLSLIGCDNNPAGGDSSAVSSNQTPVADDYNISNLAQVAGSVTAVIVTPKTGAGARGAPAASNIRYTGEATPPQAAGTYAVTFDVAGVPGWNEAKGLSAGNLIVSPAPEYGIRLTQTGTLTFPSIDVGSTAPSAQPVGVENTGTQATGALTVALSGTNAGSFALSTTSIASIAVGGTASAAFTVGPIPSLPVGIYTATVTVSNSSNNISASFNVIFTVNAGGTPSTYAITLSPANDYTFPAVNEGYSNAPSARSVTVTNSGNQATGALTVALSGTNASSFTVTPSSIPSIAVGQPYRSVTVVPNIGLTQGLYTATVTVSGGNGISRSFNVSFTVNAPGTTPPVYRINLSQTGTYTFDAINQGSTTLPSALPVSITNTGDEATGALTAALSGTNANIFTLSTQSIASIAVGATTNGAFTVRPNNLSLDIGTYNATVTVTGGNGIFASFNVSFTVAARLTYGISLSETGTYTFDTIDEGTNVPSALQVRVSNTGTGATGALTVALSGTNANIFTLSTASIGSIAANGGPGTFTVRPNISGVTHGTHTATVTVTGGNDISASFNLSFTVRQLALNISLDKSSKDFGVRVSGYSAITAETVTITNIGTQATGVNITLVGTDAANFTVTPSSIASIPADGTGTFTVKPNDGLTTVKVYEANVIVVAGTIIKTFEVMFEVNSLLSPVLSDYDITGSLTQVAGAVTGLIITPKTGVGSRGDNGAPPPSTIKYNGIAALPTTAGLYAVTFDVAPTGAYASEWNSVEGISAGTLTVTASGLPQSGIVTVWKDATQEVTFGPANSTITTSTGSQTITVSGMNAAAIKGWYLNGGLAQASGLSYTFTRTASTRTGVHTVTVLIEIDSKLYKADAVITVQ